MSKDEELPYKVIQLALDGDQGAFRRLYLRYDPTVRWAVGLRVHRWRTLIPLFDDIVQEVWLHLTRRDYKLLRYYKDDRGATFSRFLAVISTRIGWRLAKRHLGHPEIELAAIPEGQAPDSLAKFIEADFLVRLAEMVMGRLDEKDHRLFYGYYVQGEKLKDIGKQLGMNENAAYKRHDRMRKKVIGLADELLGDASPRIPPELVIAGLAFFFVVVEGQPSMESVANGGSVANNAAGRDGS